MHVLRRYSVFPLAVFCLSAALVGVPTTEKAPINPSDPAERGDILGRSSERRFATSGEGTSASARITGLSAAPGPRRIIDNLRAFAKLYGYVRWFHPSDEAASIDWDRFAVYGARFVRDADTPEDLRRRLESVFSPIAPTVRIYRDGEGIAPPDLIPKDTAGLVLVAWQHRGVGLHEGGLYRSIRLNRPDPYQVPQAILYQQRDVTLLRGRTVRLSAATRFVPGEGDGRIALFLQIHGPGGKLFEEDTEGLPGASGTWNPHQISGPVSEDATHAIYGMVLRGAGHAGLREVRMEVQQDDGSWTRVAAVSQVDESGEPGILPVGWHLDQSAQVDYVVNAIDASGAGDFLALDLPELPVAEPLFDQCPGAREATDVPVGRGLRVRVPLALYSTGEHTIPAAAPEAYRRLMSELDALDSASLDAGDEAGRAGAVVILWNVLQHFYPYFDVVDVDWDDALTLALAGAVGDDGPREFLNTLNRMLHSIGDAHAEAYHPVLGELRGLPIRLAWVEGGVVVVASDDTATARPGDRVLRLDGVPAWTLVERKMGYMSGSENWRRHRALSHPLRGIGRGIAGTDATLELLRGTHFLRVHRIRDATRLPEERRPPSFEPVANGIVYVDLTEVRLEEVETHIQELADARGVIFDLRGYPKDNDIRLVLSHLSDDVLQSGHWNVPLVSYPDRKRTVGWDARGRWTLAPREPRLRGRAVFLADSRAVSFTESVLGIVEAYGLGDIVGRPTAGVTGNVNTFSLPGGFQVGWTGMKYLRPDSTRYHGIGIRPSVRVRRSAEAIREGRDEDLARAVALLLRDAGG
jgi:C-terminal processing protease CtpA/Prc